MIGFENGVQRTTTQLAGNVWRSKMPSEDGSADVSILCLPYHKFSMCAFTTAFSQLSEPCFGRHPYKLLLQDIARAPLQLLRRMRYIDQEELTQEINELKKKVSGE